MMYIIPERLFSAQSSAVMNIVKFLMTEITITLRKRDLSSIIKSIYFFSYHHPTFPNCHTVSLNLAWEKKFTDHTYVIQIVY